MKPPSKAGEIVISRVELSGGTTRTVFCVNIEDEYSNRLINIEMSAKEFADAMTGKWASMKYEVCKSKPK